MRFGRCEVIGVRLETGGGRRKTGEHASRVFDDALTQVLLGYGNPTRERGLYQSVFFPRLRVGFPIKVNFYLQPQFSRLLPLASFLIPHSSN